MNTHYQQATCFGDKAQFVRAHPNTPSLVSTLEVDFSTLNFKKYSQFAVLGGCKCRLGDHDDPQGGCAKF